MFGFTNDVELTLTTVVGLAIWSMLKKIIDKLFVDNLAEPVDRHVIDPLVNAGIKLLDNIKLWDRVDELRHEGRSLRFSITQAVQEAAFDFLDVELSDNQLFSIIGHAWIRNNDKSYQAKYQDAFPASPNDLSKVLGEVDY